MCAFPEFGKIPGIFPLFSGMATSYWVPDTSKAAKGLSAFGPANAPKPCGFGAVENSPQCGFLAAAAFGVGLLAAGLELTGADCPWSSSCRTWRASAILALASSSEQGLLAVEVDVVDVDESAARSAMMRSLAWVSVHCTLPALGTLEVTGLVKSTFLAYRSARVCPPCFCCATMGCRSAIRCANGGCVLPSSMPSARFVAGFAEADTPLMRCRKEISPEGS